MSIDNQQYQPRWTKTRNSYSHAVADPHGAPAFPSPGMSTMIDREALTEDMASEEFFSAYPNWYGSSYECRTCPSHLYKTVFPEGQEFEIATDDPATPRIRIKRLFSCANCKRFVTTAASEEDVYNATRLAELTGDSVAKGLLGDPNNFEYQCASIGDYRELLQTTNAIGTLAGRQDAGYISLDGSPRLASAATADDLLNSLEPEEQATAMIKIGWKAYKEGDLGAATTWYQRAAELGNTDAMSNLGVFLKRSGDRAAARTWLTRAAELGNKFAMTNLGELEAEEGNRNAARTWSTRAAELGDESAMHDLGLLAFEDGDRATAKSWWTRAAAQGFSNSMCNLGVLAEQDGDLVAARAWLERAAGLGNPGAKINLTRIDAEGPIGGTARNSSASMRSASQKTPQSAKNADRGGCFVATAVYGSYDCPEVWTLRRWRDTRLASNAVGRRAIRLYYGIGPVVIRTVGHRAWFMLFARWPLDRFVNRLQAAGFSSAPYSDR